MIRFLAKEIHDANIMFGDVALPNMLSGPLSARPSIYPLDSLDTIPPVPRDRQPLLKETLMILVPKSATMRCSGYSSMIE